MSGTRCTAEVATVWRDGGAGGVAVAGVLESADGFDGTFTPLYPLNAKVEDKIDTIAREIYGADGVQYTKKARNDLARIDRIGLGDLPYLYGENAKIIKR